MSTLSFRVSAGQSSDSKFVTLKVASGSFVGFEIDTGPVAMFYQFLFIRKQLVTTA